MAAEARAERAQAATAAKAEQATAKQLHKSIICCDCTHHLEGRAIFARLNLCCLLPLESVSACNCPLFRLSPIKPMNKDTQIE